MENRFAEITIPPGIGVSIDMTDTGERLLDQIYDAYAHRLYRYALAITGSAEDAEDAVQEVFVRVAREWKRVARIECHKAYLFSATRNAAFSILRSKKRREALAESVCVEMMSSSNPDAAQIAQTKLVCQVLASLPVDQREVLVLKVYDEMSLKEIANTVGTSLNTVASRYRYAIDKLRKALEVSDDE